MVEKIEKPAPKSFTYYAAPGDPKEITVFGVTFTTGKAEMVDNPAHQAKLERNFTFMSPADRAKKTAEIAANVEVDERAKLRAATAYADLEDAKNDPDRDEPKHPNPPLGAPNAVKK